MSVATERVTNALTVDVEEWFQVHALAGVIQRPDWSALPARVEAATDRILEMLAETGNRATFFTLGWVARRHPRLVRRIVDAGHELASHGWDHQRVDALGPERFRDDLRAAKRCLEDLTGAPVRGYRAPSFSVGAATPWAHAILAEEGHSYSSSIYPIRHDSYGMPDAPRFPFRPGDGVIELPPATVEVLGRRLPCAGGGYFRLAPYALSRAGLRHLNGTEKAPAIFYFHPWEIDPGHPVPRGLRWKVRLRHRLNLTRMERRLRALLRDFAWDRVDRVFEREIAPS